MGKSISIFRWSKGLILFSLFVLLLITATIHAGTVEAGTWQQVPGGGFSKIEVAPNGDIYAYRGYPTSLSKWNGSSWVLVNSYDIGDVCFDSNSNPYITMHSGGAVYIWNGSWNNIGTPTSEYGHNMARDGNGYVWVSGPNETLYYWNNSSWINTGSYSSFNGGHLKNLFSYNGRVYFFRYGGVASAAAGQSIVWHGQHPNGGSGYVWETDITRGWDGSLWVCSKDYNPFGGDGETGYLARFVGGESWELKATVPGVDIETFTITPDGKFYLAGQSGKVYSYNGSSLVYHSQVPGGYSVVDLALAKDGSIWCISSNGNVYRYNETININAISATQNSVSLAFGWDGKGITPMTLEISTDNVNFSSLGSVSGSSHSVTGLNPGVTYYFRLRTSYIGDNGISWSLESNTASITTIPPTPPAPTGSISGLGWSKSAGRGKVVLSWPASQSATGYKLWVFDGNIYRGFDVGNTTVWDSGTARIYPDEAWLDGQANNSVSGDPFNRAQGGNDLRDDPVKLYIKTIGITYDSSHNYWFRVSAYNTYGESPQSDAYTPTLPNRTDTAGPMGSITVISTEGLNKTFSQSIKLTVTASDSESGVRGVQFSNDGVTWSLEQALVSEYNWTITPGAGTKTVYCRIWDNAGNSSTITGAIALADDNISPSVTLLVNNVALSTTNNNVTITVTVTDNISLPDQTQMSFSNDGSLWSEWEAYQQTKDWNITATSYGGTAGAGIKKIYCRVYDQAQNIGRASVEIGYNPNPPVTSISVTGGVAGTFDGQNVIFVGKDTINLNIGADGATQMRFDAGAGWFDWKPYENNKQIVLAKSTGTCSIAVQIKDQFGIISDPVEKTILIDGKKPEIMSFKTVSGAVATSGNSIQAAVEVVDDVSSTFTYSLDGTNYSSLPVDGIISLPVNNAGYNFIVLRIKDEAGNMAIKTITIRKL